MASTYFRHQLHLYRYQVILLFFFCFLGSLAPAWAQKKVIKKNLPAHDLKPMHYGFYLAGNISRHTLEHSQEFVQKNTFSAINPKFGPGFTIGFVLNKRLTDFVDGRLLPGVGFYSRPVEFVNGAGDSTGVQEMGSTAIEFPLMFKFKSLRRGNIRMYFIGGAKASVDVGNKKKANESTGLVVNSEDFQIEYGVGLDMFYPFFKFAPELRFSHGLTDRFAPGSNPYSRNVQSLRSHTITLYLNFEN
ncbi:MAG: porin family protein [Adhaeribacter sp.]